MPLLLGFYFAAHVIARTGVSTSLDYDESEQVFLSQFVQMGYNSQPPLYTWIQAGLFEIFGYSVVALALLKNLLLWMTYLLVFATVRKASDDSRIAAVATLGMFAIPQIAWESHRDLSHTVAATFATSLLCYCIVSLAKHRSAGDCSPAHARRTDNSMLWYTLIGIAVGIGVLFKYNFVLVVIGFVAASLSIPRYRPLLLDRRILVSIFIAGVITLPHGIWMLGHMDLVSAKTVSTMTSNRSHIWIENVVSGFAAMSLSFISCCALTVAVFFILFVRRRGPQLDVAAAYQPDRLLLERFLLAVILMLSLIVLTGHASEFKNRWFQPFVCFVPAYLALRFGPSIVSRRRGMNWSAGLAVGMMLIILTMVISRPTLSRYRGKYCWLNVPYARAWQVIRDQSEIQPDIIVSANMRVAGNLKMQHPEADIVSFDAKHLGQELEVRRGSASTGVLVVADQQSAISMGELADFARRRFDQPLVDKCVSSTIEVEYQYGAAGDTQRFVYSEFELAPIADSSAEIASRPGATEH